MLLTHENLLKVICSERRNVNTNTLQQVITLALEVAREGREGRRIGTIFAVSDDQAVFERSHPLILDPLVGHPDEEKRLDRATMRETAKELAQLDGAFIVRDDGVVRSACRYLNASSLGLDLPLGLGSRHIAGASISQQTNAVGVVVSESAIVRVFDDGELIAEIIPELWMLRKYTQLVQGPTTLASDDRVAVVSQRQA